MNKETLFSSGKNDWETPPEVFITLDKIHNFTLDPCATPENAKCQKFYTEEDNGLLQSWAGETVFVNPPYSSREQNAWIKKCYDEHIQHNITVVALLPARTDTARFHDYIYDKARIWFIRGRLKFVGAANPAPFPSMVVIWEKVNI